MDPSSAVVYPWTNIPPPSSNMLRTDDGVEDRYMLADADTGDADTNVIEEFDGVVLIRPMDSPLERYTDALIVNDPNKVPTPLTELLPDVTVIVPWFLTAVVKTILFADVMLPMVLLHMPITDLESTGATPELVALYVKYIVELLPNATSMLVDPVTNDDPAGVSPNVDSVGLIQCEK